MGGHRGGHRVRRGPRGPPDRADGLVDGRRHRAAHLRALGPPRPDPQSDPGLAGGRLAGHPDLPRRRAAGTASHAPAGPVDDDLPARREDGAPARTAGAARDETRVPRRPPGPPDPAVPRAGRCHGPTRPEPPAGRSTPRPGGVRARRGGLAHPRMEPGPGTLGACRRRAPDPGARAPGRPPLPAAAGARPRRPRAGRIGGTAALSAPQPARRYLLMVACSPVISEDSCQVRSWAAPLITRGEGPPTLRWVTEKHSSSSRPSAASRASEAGPPSAWMPR